MVSRLDRSALSYRWLSRSGFVLALALLLSWLPISAAATLALGAVAALLAIIYPWAVWLVLAATLPVAAGFRFGPVSPADILVAFGLALWWIDTVRRRSVYLQSVLPVAPILVYLAVLAGTALGAPDLGEALLEVVKWVEFAGVVLVMPLVFPSRLAEWLVVALVAAAVTQSAMGLYQFVYRIGPDWFLIQGRFMRASGVFRQPNPYAGYLGLTLPVAVSLSFHAIGRLRAGRANPVVWIRLWFYLGAATMIGLGLIASWSRGGWLGAAAGLALVLLLYSRQTVVTLTAAVMGVSLLALGGVLDSTWIPGAVTSRLADLPAYFGLGGVLDRPVTDENFAVVERLAHWIAAMRMWASHLWFGVGPGNYSAAYASVALPRWSDPLGHAHNIYLNVLAETGLVGLTVFAGMWLSLGSWLVVEARRRTEPFRRALAVGVAGVLAHLAVHSIVDNLFVQGMVIHLALWFVAVAVTTPESPRGSDAHPYESD